MMHRRVAAAVLGLMAPLGCATVPLGVAHLPGYTYEGGLARLELPVSRMAVESAALEAMSGLGYGEIAVHPEGEAGSVVEARTADHRSARLTLRPTQAGGTALSVRVGRRGDEREERKLLERIGGRLGAIDAARDAGPRTTASAGPTGNTGVPEAVMIREQAGSPGLMESFQP